LWGADLGATSSRCIAIGQKLAGEQFSGGIAGYAPVEKNEKERG
jgi:hypothetical protein